MSRYFILLLLCFSYEFCIGQFKQFDLNEPAVLLCPDSTVTIVYDEDLYFHYGVKGGKVIGLDSVIAVSAGYFVSLFLKSDSTVWVQGINEHGEQTLGSTDSKYYPVHKIQKLERIVKIDAGDGGNMAAIDEDGHVWIWGSFNNYISQPQCPDYNVFCTPHKLNIENVSDVSIEPRRILIQCEDGKIWQKDTYFDSNPANTIDSLEEAVNIKNVSKISCGFFIYYALTSSGDLISWDNCNDIPDTVDHNVSQIDASNMYVLYMKNDGTVWYYDENTPPFDDIRIKVNATFNAKSIFSLWGYFALSSDDDEIWVSEVFQNSDARDSISDLVPKNWNCIDCESVTTDTSEFDTIINPNTNILLTASNNNGGMYLWYPSTGISDLYSQTQIINIASSNTFKVDIFDTTGCIYKHEVFNLHVRDCDTIIYKYAHVALDTVVIPETIGILRADGNPPYIWSPINGLSCNDCKEPNVQFINSIQYSVSQKDVYNCTYSQEYFIKVRECDTIITQQYYLKLDTTVVFGSQIVLHPSPSYSNYTWLPNPRLSCTDCAEPTYQCNGDEILYVNLYNTWNCPYTEMFSINTMEESLELVIPDIFTPNGDGYNDYFEVIGLRANTTLKIFNRQGKLLYSNSNYQNNWDGRDNNENMLDQDNYFYVLIIVGGAAEYKGSVFIKR